MEKEFGKIKKGTEEAYAMLLFPLESNVLKVHRADPSSNSRRLREAIALVLFDIRMRYTNENYNVEAFRNEENERLEKALLMAFDPFTNSEVEQIVGTEMESSQLHDYYQLPVMCLLRIKDSIDTLEKNAGADGYFIFIEQYMGAKITGTDMTFSVLEQL